MGAVSTQIVSLTPTIVSEPRIVPAVAGKKEETSLVYDLIQARQDELGLSIRQLGERTGVTHSLIAKHKQGYADPLLSTIVDLAKAANVTPVEMFEAFLGKKPEASKLKSRKLAKALAIYESSPEAQEKLGFMVEMFIRETEKLEKD